MHPVAVDGHFHVDRDHPLAHRRIDVDEIRRLPNAIGHFQKPLPGERLDVILDFGERLLDDFDAVLVAEAPYFAFGDATGLRLGLKVADDVGGRPRIVGDELGHVGQIDALAINPDRRDAKTLGHMIERTDVERPRHRAADVRPMAVGLGEAEQLTFVEHGSEDAGVVEVRAALIDVIDHEDVARVDVAFEFVDHGFGGVVQCADMGGDVAAALHHRVAVDVAERRGKIARPDHERIAGAKDLLRHLVDDVNVGVLEYFEGDGIE